MKVIQDFGTNQKAHMRLSIAPSL